MGLGGRLWAVAKALPFFFFRRWELWEGFDPRKDWIGLSSLRRRGHGDKGYRRGRLGRKPLGQRQWCLETGHQWRAGKLCL